MVGADHHGPVWAEHCTLNVYSMYMYTVHVHAHLCISPDSLVELKYLKYSFLDLQHSATFE